MLWHVVNVTAGPERSVHAVAVVKVLQQWAQFVGPVGNKQTLADQLTHRVICNLSNEVEK